MRKAWNWSRLMLLLPAVVGMVSVAEAVDLQGTWDATAKCTLYPNGANPEKLIPVKGTIQISQSGQELAFNTSLLGNYQAFEWDDPVHIHKAVVGGGICPSPGFPALLGLFGTVTTAQDGDGASMAIDMNGATIEGPVKCHVTAQRTSAADPVVTTCPACSFAITPTRTNRSAADGSSTVAVSTGSGCAWSASNLGVSWLSVSPAAGTGPGTVTVSVAVNGRASPARTATISIATRAFKVTQRGE